VLIINYLRDWLCLHEGKIEITLTQHYWRFINTINEIRLKSPGKDWTFFAFLLKTSQWNQEEKYSKKVLMIEFPNPFIHGYTLKMIPCIQKKKKKS